MLNEKEKSELKKKNLELINEWVKEYCEDDFRCMVEHAFRYNGKDYRISASKKGIGVASYGKYAKWCHVGSTDNNLETMLFATELILHWKEIKSRIIAKFDYLEERPFDQEGNLLPGYCFESIILEADSDDYQYRSNDSKSIIWPEKKIHLPENLKELSPETGEETNTYVVAFLSNTTPCINLAISGTKEKVKAYFLNDLDVDEKDFISVRLATEDDKHPGIPVHHIPEYPYVLHIEYSWGDREPNQKFSTKEDAWKKAMSMAMTEADTASDEKEDGEVDTPSDEKEDETVEIIIEKAKLEISLVYPKSAEENSFCRYYITKEKGE